MNAKEKTELQEIDSQFALLDTILIRAWKVRKLNLEQSEAAFHDAFTAYIPIRKRLRDYISGSTDKNNN